MCIDFSIASLSTTCNGHPARFIYCVMISIYMETLSGLGGGVRLIKGILHVSHRNLSVVGVLICCTISQKIENNAKKY